MKTKLWSIQQIDKLEEINSTGRLVCMANTFSKEWDNEYRWMATQMMNRVGQPENKDQYPIWAWYQYRDSIKMKPDLRGSGFLPTGTKGIRIEFEKDKDELLLSDFELWHFPLSYKSYIPENEAEMNRFEDKLKEQSLDKIAVSYTHLTLPTIYSV